ncbi:diguanylate cyclase [Shewanella sp. FJAT-51649]|uniref:GGDEF domain-containing protein n=1 Tax=Shewanella sp. FJAT-51649 TaxID=2864210 RepID=UPI001C65DF9D|nr:diguanylate cyclase [Shewanella sp. FJAT-51649]QYJ69875.1 diguanylate cyclase [Shewanella sp. FJAT-51649]
MKTLFTPFFPLRQSNTALLLAGILYWITGALGQTLFSLQPANITLIWLPSGVALVMLLMWGRKALALIFLGSFMLNIQGMVQEASLMLSIAHTAISALIDMLAPAMSMYLLRRFLPLGTRSANDLMKFVVVAGIVPILGSSALLSGNLVLGGYIQPSEFWSMGQMFFFADILGIVLVYQLYAGWVEPNALKIDHKRHILLPLIGLPFFCLIGVRFDLGWLFYVIPPLLVVLSFEVTRFYLALFSSASMLFMILATAQGYGPFINPTPFQTNAEMMAFVLSSALTIFGVSLQRAQLRRTERDKQTAVQEALYDPLSGLLNRRGFMPQLANLDTSTTSYSVAMLDLDNFKIINDTYGHSVGDRVIQLLAQLIHNHSRSHDIAARLGGEEFALVLRDIDAAQVQPVLERIRRSFAEMSIAAEEHTIYCTVSIGWVEYLQGSAGESLLHLADKALYQAKAKGKNTIVKYQA